MAANSESTPFGRLRALFARQSDPYAEADREAARKFGGWLFLVQAVLVAGLAPLTPPTSQLEPAGGWVVLAGAVMIFVGIGLLLLLQGNAVNDNQLLALNYLAVGSLAALIWLDGGRDAAYLPVFLLWVVFVPSSHPPRRTAVFFLFMVLAAGAPLLYEGWERGAAAEILAQCAVWLLLAIMISLRVQTFRRQRIGLRRGKDAAIKLAVTDPLTGLANRRAFGEVLEREVSRARRSESSLALVLADLDGFKEINDRHGHVKGDQYLRRVAETLRSMLRENDLGFRWGGDEFALLLPDTSRMAADMVCARLGRVVSAALEETAGVEITLSFGIAEYLEGMSAEDLVRAADLDLMEGKAGAGTNAE